MKKHNLILFVFVFFIVHYAVAQKTTIKGQVTTFDVIEVINAEVTVKKSKTTVLTDSLGYFTIDCDLKDKLLIKATGFITETIKVKKLNGKEKIDIEIVGGEDEIDKAVSNGHIKAGSVSDAKKHYNAMNRYNYGFNNLTELISAKFPQFKFVGDELIMRGITGSITESSNNNGALFVLNGSTYNWGSVKNLEVRTVKNLKILTGTAATRYGAGSGNGVILIENYADNN